MAELKRTNLSVRRERALLVAVILPESSADPADPLGELRSLARTAGAQVVDEIVARRRSVHPGLYVGSGKAAQIAERAGQNSAETIIFDNDLSPAQIRDLEEVVGRKVLDRSELILDIFASHARTAESRLQVELAQLEYTYPRLRHMWSHLERLAGGASTAAAAVGGIGTRGPGEKQIETDRRLVQKRVSYLKRRIAAIDKRKVRQVRARKGTFCICLVGYTNAGKSTLMNRLTDADAVVADMLFATLETKTRRWRLGDGRCVLLSDTVGFVRDLPHHLVASFRATLEEAIWADLLIHVADALHERVQQEIIAVERVLAELGCADQRRLLLLNKTDKVNDPTVRTVLSQQFPDALFGSAATGEGIDELVDAVARRAGGEPVCVTLRANCRNGRLMQYIAQHADMRDQSFADATAEIEAVMAADCLDRLRAFGDDVEILCQTGS
ncbi:MAG: GTPase HflX [Planctomycetota bacterium]|nr:GTPase HflX [Planctomycetota bacterium]